ncbi:MAG: hypothetical protein HC876_10080 [Chloroflexaceae bacterium]|nr:hypothetical protein [Chloroflexaceae bacterium]
MLVLLFIVAPVSTSRSAAADVTVDTPKRTVRQLPLAQATYALRIADTQVDEADNDQTAEMVFTVTLAQPLPAGASITVEYTTIDESAVSPIEYIAESGTLTFSGSTTEQTISVTTNGNEIYRPSNKTFSVQISNVQITNNGGGALTPDDVGITRDTAVGTIVENETVPVLSVRNVEVTERDDEKAVVALRLTPASEVEVRIDYEVLPCDPGSLVPEVECAFPGLDFVEQLGTVRFGGSQGEIVFDILNEDIPELDEVFYVRLFNAQGLTLPDDDDEVIVTVTIDDEDIPVASLSSPTYEVSESERSINIGVILNYPPVTGTEVLLSLAATGIDAVLDEDFRAPGPGELRLREGQTSANFSIGLVRDNIREPQETVALELNIISGATIGITDTATLTIIDDDGIPSFSTSGQQIPEGAAGETRNAAFNVRLSTESIDTLQIDYQIDVGTNQVGVDYTIVDPLQGTLTFEPGTTNQTVDIQFIGNNIDQVDRQYTILLSNARPTDLVQIAENGEQGIITIDDDDGPTVAFARTQYVVAEDAGTASIEVRLSTPSPQEIGIRYATQPISAVTDIDFEAVNSTLIFTPGITVGRFEVPIIDDALEQGDLTFRVVLSNPSDASLGTPIDAIVVIEDDEGPARISFDATEYQAVEGTDAVTVTLAALVTKPAEEPFGVLVRTTDQTAQADSDYVAFDDEIMFDISSLPVPMTITEVFTPVVLTEQFTITVLDDAFFEAPETFGLELVMPVGDAELVAPLTATVQIDNDDPPPTLVYIPQVIGPQPAVRFGSALYTVNEDAGEIVLDIAVNGAVRSTSTIAYRTQAETALAGQDYITTTGVITFSPTIPPTTVQQVRVPIIDNDIRDRNRQFIVILTNPTGNLQLAVPLNITTVVINDDELTLNTQHARPARR